MIEASESVVIGSGALGASIAFHLARGGKQVALLDQHALGSQTSPRAAGLTSQARGTDLMTTLAKRAVRKIEAFERETGESGFETATFEWPAGERKAVSVRYLPRDPRHPRAFNRLEIDPSSGDVVSSRRYAGQPAGDRLLASIFPLHSGRYFGWPGAIAFMLASLCMPLFTVTGWMLYLQRRRRSVAGRWSVASAEQ